MKTKSIYELVGITKQELEKLIPILHPNAQTFIKKRFTKKYYRTQKIKWTQEDNNYFFGIIRRLRKLSKRKDNNQGFKTKKGLLERIGCTKEELENIIPRLENNPREFILSHFNTDFTFKNNFDSWTKSDKNYFNFFIIKHIKRILEAKSEQLMPLYHKFSVSKEEFREIVSLLSPKSQKLINYYYDENYMRLLNNKKTKEDRKYMGDVTFEKIREIINKKDIPKYSVYRNLLEYHNLTKYQMKTIIPYLNPELKQFLSNYYDENFVLYENIELTVEERYYIYHSLGYNIETISKKFGYDIINEDYNKKTKEQEFESIKNDIEKPLSKKMHYNKKLDLLKIKSDYELRRVERLRRIQLMREFYKNYQAQLSNEKKCRVVLKRTN